MRNIEVGAISSPPDSTTFLEVVTAIGAFGSVVGLICDHLWVRHKLAKTQMREEFYRSVEMTISTALERIADLLGDLKDWENDHPGHTIQTVKSSGIRLSRKLNQATNRIASSHPSVAKEWLAISTEELDGSLEALSPGTKLIGAAAVRSDADRLENALQDTLSRTRPA